MKRLGGSQMRNQKSYIQQALDNIFAIAEIADGWDDNNNTIYTKVYLSLVEQSYCPFPERPNHPAQKIVILSTSSGAFFSAHLPDVSDQDEAWWRLNNHPNSSLYFNLEDKRDRCKMQSFSSLGLRPRIR